VGVKMIENEQKLCGYVSFHKKEFSFSSTYI